MCKSTKVASKAVESANSSPSSKSHLCQLRRPARTRHSCRRNYAQSGIDTSAAIQVEYPVQKDGRQLVCQLESVMPPSHVDWSAMICFANCYMHSADRSSQDSTGSPCSGASSSQVYWHFLRLLCPIETVEHCDELCGHGFPMRLHQTGANETNVIQVRLLPQWHTLRPSLLQDLSRRQEGLKQTASSAVS